MDVDPVWEYNAPQFVDFSRPIDDDPGVDQFFEIDHEDEKIRNDEHFGSEEQSAPDAFGSCSEKRSGSSDKTDNVDVDMKTSDCEDKRGSNDQSSESIKGCESVVETSPALSDEQKGATETEHNTSDAATSDADGPNAESRRPETPQLEGNIKENSARKGAKVIPHRPRTRSLDLGQMGLSGQKKLHSNSASKNSDSSQRKSGSQESFPTEAAGKVSAATRRRSQSQDKLDRPASPSGEKRTYTGKLTMPQTPSFMKRELKFLHVNPVKSSEVQEMDKIRVLRQALAQKRKLAAESRVVALTANNYAPVRSKQPVTRPQEFHFSSDARLKGPAPENGPASTWKELDFASELRKHNEQTTAAMPSKTIPVPFNLHASKKRHSSGDSHPPEKEKFETMAEKVIKFCSKTPERFRAKPTNDRRSAGSQNKNLDHDAPKLTVPKTPNLVARTRARPVHIPSQADKEEMELELIKKSKFKALPFNPKIFENAKLGVKKVTPKAVTKPEPFDLEMNRCLQHRKRSHSESASEQHYEFHAQPVPKKILLGPVGVNPPKEIPLTVPQSPAFASKYQLRSTVKHEEPEVEQMPKIMKALPVPHVGIPFQPKLDHQATVVEPFSFEHRAKEMQDKKELQIKKILEEEKKAREFHAQPLKDLQPVLPERKARPPTTPEPFKLEIETRCAARIEEWKHKVEQDENERIKMAASFKAKPPSILEKEPFAPAKSSKPLTEASDLQLNTEKRAEKRQEWEAWNNDKLTEQEYERLQQEKAKLEEEEKEVQRMRTEAVPKAHPVRQYKAVHILPSDQPLTNPESPRFSERLKSKTLRH